MKEKCGYCHKNPVSDEEVAKILGLCETCSKTLVMGHKENLDVSKSVHRVD